MAASPSDVDRDCDSTARRSPRSTAPASSTDVARPARSTCATRCGGWSPPACGRGTRPAGSSSPAWAARRSAARWPARSLGDHASRPMLASRAATGCRPWTTPDTTVLCASLLGQHRGDARLLRGGRRARRAAHRRDDRRRLAERARADGVPVIPVAGGFQPRAAVGYMTVAALEVAAPVRRRAADGRRDRRRRRPPRGARRRVGARRRRGLARPSRSRARCTARVPVIAGAGLTPPIAYRWKTQFNENAKLPAFAHELPELDHNEIVGWAAARRRSGRFAAVFLDDPTRTRASQRAHRR